MPELLFAPEIAERLDITEATLRDWERLGKIPSIRTGRRVVFNLDSVIDAIRSNRASNAQQVAN